MDAARVPFGLTKKHHQKINKNKDPCVFFCFEAVFLGIFFFFRKVFQDFVLKSLCVDIGGTPEAEAL